MPMSAMCLRVASLVLLLGGVGVLPGRAQETPADAPDLPPAATIESPPRAAFTITMGLAYKTRVHAPDDMKAALKDAGYHDETLSGKGALPWYGGGSSNPSAGLDEWGGAFSVGYDFERRFGVRLMISDGDFVHAWGEHTDPDTSEESQVSFGTKLTSFGLVAEYNLAPAIRVGLGPAYYRLGVDSFADGDVSHDNYSTAGLLLEAMLTLPARTRMFFFFNFQRHQVLSVDIGPYGLMESAEIGLSHNQVVVGVGVRSLVMDD